MAKPIPRLNASRALLSWLVVACAGACVLAACSDDDDGGPGGPVAMGGEAGEAQVGGGGAKPSGGNDPTGGTPDGAGQGQGGAGGAPEPPLALGEVCSACGDSECSTELAACTDNQECSPWLRCLRACADEACVTACDDEHADVARVYTGIYECLCDSCEDECSGAKACEKSACVPDDVLPPTETIPATLAETGLYAGYAIPDEGLGGAGGAGGANSGGDAPELDPAVAPLTLAGYVRGFEPTYPLWADGAEKQRYVYIPKCSTIDTTDMDHWRFPVGTRLWKHFDVESAAGKVRVETRLMHRFGPGEADWAFATYQWDIGAPDDPAAALFVPEGVLNANGTTHDIPSSGQCTQCHATISERVLGFSAIQLSHDASADDLTIAKISNLGWLSEPAPAGFEVPGTPVQRAALGYLHGNCGGCHHQAATLGASALKNNSTALVTRLLVGMKTYESTATATSAVGVIVGSPNAAIVDKARIDPMAPDDSAVLIRMKSRAAGVQMPAFGTKVPDTDGGVADVSAWIASLPAN